MGSMGRRQRLGIHLLKLSRSAEVMLVLSGLLQRGFGFLSSLVLARLVGVEAVGLYTSLQISSSSLTSPLSAPLANSATLVATEHKEHVSLRALVLAHLPPLAATGLLAALGSSALVLWWASQTTAWQQWPLWLPLFFVSLLSFSTLGSQMMAGLFHGAGKSLPLARVTMACTIFGILACWPVAAYFGVTGSLSLAATVLALPVLILAGLALLGKGAPSMQTQGLNNAISSGFKMALPNMVSTLIHNVVTWYCCIYLVQQHQGPSGVGLVTIGLQWMMLMQLPSLAWGGKMVADMGAAQQRTQQDLLQATRHWLSKSAWSTALIGLAVSSVGQLIAHLYHLQNTELPWLLAADALASVLLASTFVQERAFFCLGKQRAWLALSLVGDVIQLAVTMAWGPQSVLVVPLGSICSAFSIFAGGQWILKRLQPPFNSAQS
jgi:O-antigen/teichoic acid export membrane protein